MNYVLYIIHYVKCISELWTGYVQIMYLVKIFVVHCLWIMLCFCISLFLFMIMNLLRILCMSYVLISHTGLCISYLIMDIMDDYGMIMKRSQKKIQYIHNLAINRPYVHKVHNLTIIPTVIPYSRTVFGFFIICS